MNTRYSILGTALAVASFTTADAAVLAINFMRDADRFPAAGGEFGVSNWVDINADPGAGNNPSTVAGVTIGWSAAGTWGTGGGNAVTDAYIDNAGTLTISGLGAWLDSMGDSAYTIQLVQGSDTADNSFGDTLIYDTDAGGTLLDTLTNPNVQRGLTTVSVSLTADTLFIDPTSVHSLPRPDGTAGTPRTSVAGIIITSIPEPSTFTLGGLAALALAGRRRRS